MKELIREFLEGIRFKLTVTQSGAGQFKTNSIGELGNGIRNKSPTSDDADENPTSCPRQRQAASLSGSVAVSFVRDAQFRRNIQPISMPKPRHLRRRSPICFAA
jgi:hypothetical protein